MATGLVHVEVCPHEAAGLGQKGIRISYDGPVGSPMLGRVVDALPELAQQEFTE